jgi:hypothetical protein
MRTFIRPSAFFCMIWFLFLSENSAYAYLDAGTGSMVMQILLGGLASLAVILKVFWRRILRAFGIKREEKEDIKTKVTKQ